MGSPRKTDPHGARYMDTNACTHVRTRTYQTHARTDTHPVTQYPLTHSGRPIVRLRLNTLGQGRTAQMALARPVNPSPARGTYSEVQSAEPKQLNPHPSHQGPKPTGLLLSMNGTPHFNPGMAPRFDPVPTHDSPGPGAYLKVGAPLGARLSF